MIAAKYLRIVSLLLLLCFGYGQSWAQNYYLENERTFYGGVLAGVNLTQVDGDNFAGYHKVGANVGGIAYIKFDEHLAASMEILYSQKGSRATDAQPIAPGLFITNYDINLNYAEVPILFNYFDKRKSHFGGGISYSRLAGSSEHLTIEPAPNPPIDVSKYPFKKSDYNLVLAGNLHMWKGLFLNVRFQYSLVSIRSKTPVYTRADQFSNLWVIRLMYLFI